MADATRRVGDIWTDVREADRRTRRGRGNKEHVADGFGGSFSRADHQWTVGGGGELTDRGTNRHDRPVTRKRHTTAAATTTTIIIATDRVGRGGGRDGTRARARVCVPPDDDVAAAWRGRDEVARRRRREQWSRDGRPRVRVRVTRRDGRHTKSVFAAARA